MIYIVLCSLGQNYSLLLTFSKIISINNQSETLQNKERALKVLNSFLI